jgi:hypothetical protein
MNYRRNLRKMVVWSVAALVLTCGTVRLIGVCGNEGASNSDHINSQCSYCLCANGTWFSWYFSGQTNACSGTVYGANVTQDISCGNNWTIVYIPGCSCPIVAICNSAPFSGNCDMGTCSGLMGPTGPLAEHYLLQSVGCNPYEGCPG